MLCYKIAGIRDKAAGVIPGPEPVPASSYAEIKLPSLLSLGDMMPATATLVWHSTASGRDAKMPFSRVCIGTLHIGRPISRWHGPCWRRSMRTPVSIAPSIARLSWRGAPDAAWPNWCNPTIRR